MALFGEKTSFFRRNTDEIQVSVCIIVTLETVSRLGEVLNVSSDQPVKIWDANS